MIYKQLIRKRLLALKRKNSIYKSCRLAERLQIEASYLSRFFSDGSVHFSDELLFMLVKDLKMSNLEIERIFILKELERTSLPERKIFLEERLQNVRGQQIQNQIITMKNDLLEIVEILSVKK